MGCEPTPTTSTHLTVTFQSTHPCGVRIDITQDFDFTSSVSIHAPVWGAKHQLIITALPLSFQSTHPCGVRNCKQQMGVGLTVSIHAPVWGAKRLIHHAQFMVMFQSTHPCGVRTCLIPVAFIRSCFNPRTRVGCETNIKMLKVVDCVSIHAPVWGAKLLRIT